MADMNEARQIGVSGVPFFVFNGKYAVSGAQEDKVFLEILNKSFSEWKKQNPENKLNIQQGLGCNTTGECE